MSTPENKASGNSSDQQPPSQQLGVRWGSFTGIRNLGQSLRIQAEEFNAKAKNDADQKDGTDVSYAAVDNENATSGSETFAEKRAENSNLNDTPSKPSPGLLANRNPNDVSREELLDVLQKLNKRVKGLSAIRMSLTDRVKQVERDKSRLMSLLKNEILTEADLEDASREAVSRNAEAAMRRAEGDANGEKVESEKIDEIEVLLFAWRAADERKQLMLQQIQSEYKIISMQCQAEVEKARMAAKAEKEEEIQKLKAETEERLLEVETPALSMAESEEGIQTIVQGAVKMAIERLEAKHKEEIVRVKEEMEDKHTEKIMLMQNEAERVRAEQMELISKEALQRAKKEFEAEAEVITEEFRRQAAESNKKEVNDLEKRHATMLEEATAAHAAELDDIQTEALAVTNRIAALKKASAEKLEEMDLAHATELELARKEIPFECENKITLLMQENAARNEDIIARYSSEIERLRHDPVQAQEETKAYYESKLERIEEELNASASDEMSRQIESISNEHAAEMNSLRDKLTSQRLSEIQQLKEESILAHQLELDSLRTELTETHSVELDRVKSDLSKLADSAQSRQLEQMAEAHAAEIQRFKEEAATNMEKAVATAKKETEDLINKTTEARVSELIASHALLLERVQREASDELERMKASYSTAKEELEKLRVVSSSVQTDLDLLKVTSNAEVQLVKDELRTKVAAEIARVKSEAESSQNQWKNEFAKKSEAKLAEARDTMAAEHDAEIQRLTVQHFANTEQIRTEMSKSAAEQLKNALEKATAARNIEVSRINEEAEISLKELKSRLLLSFDEELGRVKQEAESELQRLTFDLNASLETKEDLESTIAQLSRHANTLSDEIHHAKRLEEILQDELEQLKSRAAAAAADSESIKLTIREGKEMTHQQLVEALTKQRLSFEEMIQSQQNRHAETMDALEEKYAESLALLRKSEESLAIAQKKICDADIAMHSTQENARKQVKSDGEIITQKDTELLNKDSELQRLQHRLESGEEETSQESASLLGDLFSATVAREELEALLRAAKEEGEALTIKYRDEVKSMQDSHDRSLNELQNLVNLRTAEVEAATISFNSLQTDYSNSQFQNEELQTQLQQSMSSNQKEVQALQEERAHLSIAIETIRNELQDTVQKYTIELKELREQLFEKTSQYEQLQVINNQQQLQLQQSTSFKQAELEQLQQTKKQLEDEFESLREEFKKRVQGNDENLEQLRARHADEMTMKLDEQRCAMDEAFNALKEQSKLSAAESSIKIASLQESIENSELEIKTTKAKHADELQKVQDEFALRLNAAHDENVQAILAKHALELEEKDSMAKVLKDQYEQKLEEAFTKQNKALEFAKKIKDATADRLRKAESDRFAMLEKVKLENQEILAKQAAQYEEKMAALEIQKEELFSELNVTHDRSIQLLKEKYAAVIESLTKEKDFAVEARSDLELQLKEVEEKFDAAVTSFEEERDSLFSSSRISADVKIKEITDQHSAVLLEVEKEKHELIAAEKKKFEQQMESLQISHADALNQVEQEKNSLADELEAEHDAKLKSAAAESARAKSSLEQKMAKHADDLKLYFEGKFNSAKDESDKVRIRLETEVTAKENKLAEIISELKSSSALVASLSKDNEALQDRLRTQISAEKELRDQITSLTQDLKESSENSEATALSLLEEQYKAEAQNKKLKEEITKHNNEIAAKHNSLEETSRKVSTLTASLNAMADDKKMLETKLEFAAKQEAKLNTTEAELTGLREELNALKLEQAKTSGLLSRLQADKDASERKHAQRTALIGMLEAQLSELNEKNADVQAKLEAALYDTTQKDEELQNKLQQLERAEKASVQALNARKGINEISSQGTEQDLGKKAKMIEALQREMQVLQQQMARKSSAAQRLLQEREAECKELRKQNKILQSEVDKGSLSDRRIFELAAQQSNRESAAVSEIEIRDKLVQRLTETLTNRDGDLAIAEHSVHQVEDQVEELCRVRRREDVNIDYLKGIIVQYLSKPPGSSERASLLPVLATLLQFDNNDYKMIEEGKNKVNWWGGTMPICISAPNAHGPPALRAAPSSIPEHQTAPLLSAEVTVSNNSSRNNAGRSTRTSLQF